MTKNIIIRPAKQSDAIDYMQLKNLVWRETYAQMFPKSFFDAQDAAIERVSQRFGTLLGDSKLCLVAEHNRKLIGLLNGTLKSSHDYFNNQNCAMLTAMYIHPEYQQQGIGGEFRGLFENWLKQKNIHKYVIGAFKDNILACKIYESWGGKKENYTASMEIAGKKYDEVYYRFEI